MTDLSKRYQKERKHSPKELDDQILSAAKEQADRNRESRSGFSWNSSTWMSGMAFACICFVGVMFVIDTDTSQLTDDIEFDVLQSSSKERSSHDFYDTSADIDGPHSGAQLEEVVVTAMKRAENIQDQTVETKVMSSPPVQMEENPIEESEMHAATLKELSEMVRDASISDSNSSRDRIAAFQRQKQSQSSMIESVRREIEREENPEDKNNLQERLKKMEMLARERKMERSANLEADSLLNEETPRLNDTDVVGDVPILIDLGTYIPGIILDIRYHGSNNFVGEPVDGYLAPKALVSTRAATALADAYLSAQEHGLGLKIFDAYRPQRAVNHFVRWAEDLGDVRTKPVYYPNVEKSELFAKGYIAAKSGHSRASTVDLTLVDLATGEELDMGSPFDFFDPVSWPSSQAVSEQAQQNRQTLRTIMMDNGFKPYEAEWWHFTLEDEPFPDQYFDIPVK